MGLVREKGDGQCWRNHEHWSGCRVVLLTFRCNVPNYLTCIRFTSHISIVSPLQFLMDNTAMRVYTNNKKPNTTKSFNVWNIIMSEFKISSSLSVCN